MRTTTNKGDEMKVIDIDKKEGAEFITFPDGQPHINIGGLEGDVSVVCSLTLCSKIIQLLEVSNALDRAFCNKKNLVIPYLMGARYDRLMLKGDSVDLEVMAELINNLNFEKVYLYDVHSDSALLLIKNSVAISNKELVQSYTKEESILICPDAGAAKKVEKYLEWNKNLTEIVYCTKTRDLKTGNLTINVLEPEKCARKKCVIIDDLCDGGGTFLGIASQIEPSSLTLIVTHGIFSKGLVDLCTAFEEIITSDSYPYPYKHENLKTISLNKQQYTKETR